MIHLGCLSSDLTTSGIFWHFGFLFLYDLKQFAEIIFDEFKIKIKNSFDWTLGVLSDMAYITFYSGFYTYWK